MQNDIDIYPNFSVSPTWTIITVLLIVTVLSFRFIGPKILKNISMRKQAKEINISKKDKVKYIDEAILKLQTIKSEYSQGKKSSRDAAFEASQITREAFDVVMNHKTRYQARYEASMRNLQSIADLLDNAYPPEFNGNSETTLDVSLFDKAIGVLESCR